MVVSSPGSANASISGSANKVGRRACEVVQDALARSGMMQVNSRRGFAGRASDGRRNAAGGRSCCGLRPARHMLTC